MHRRRGGVLAAALSTVVFACAPNARPSDAGAPATDIASVTTAATDEPTTASPRTAVSLTTTSVPSTPPSSATLSSETPTSARAATLALCVARLPLRQRIALLTWPALTAAQWDLAESVVRENHLGGVVLLSAPADVGPAVARLKGANPRGVLVSVDEEGGTVQRLRGLGVLPSAAQMAASHSPAQARAIIAEHAKAIAAAGIDVVLGPVVDVKPVDAEGPLGTRTFSDDPSVVAAFGRAYVEGWRDGGIVPVLKHFPGHGAASADSHTGVARTPPLAVLVQRDLLPYWDLAPLEPAVMVGHLTVPGLTTRDSLPASLDPDAINGLLRSRPGYSDALVLTDALEMGAVRAVAPLGEAAVLALIAGADVVLFSGISEVDRVLDSIEAAARQGRISEAVVDVAAARVARRYRDAGAFCSR